jgi:hypothetical protein
MVDAKRWIPAALAMGLVSAGCHHAVPVAEAARPAQPAAPVAKDPPPPGLERETWYGGYLQDRKIGYMHEAITWVQRDGVRRLLYNSSDHVDLNINGQPLTQATSTRLLCDEQFAPIEMDFALDGGGRKVTVAARFAADKIELDKTGPEGTTHKTLAVPAGTKLAGDERLDLARAPLAVGDSRSLTCFNPVALALESHDLKAERRETLAMAGEDVETTVISIKSPWATMVTWVDDDGQACRCEVPLQSAKLSFRQEPKDQALKVVSPDGQRADLITAAAIRPDKPIPDPRGVRFARYRVKGLDVLRTVPQDTGQKIEEDSDGWRTVTVTAPPPGPQPEIRKDQRQDCLKATDYIEVNHPDIQAAAKKAIEGAEGDQAKVHQIQLYVQHRVKWQWNVGLFRSALEVLHDPAGVCRDAAALFTALARAAGVPTRVCGGLLYTGDQFLGHAWAECWVGDRWLPVDATMTQPVADAARLKLSEGVDYTALFDMLPALGNLQVQVLETKGG